MSRISKKLFTVAASLMALGLLSVSSFASSAVKVTANFTYACPNCATDISGSNVYTWNGTYYNNPGGPYSLQDFPSLTPYSPSNNVESQILTNNTVYTLDTSGPNWTRTVWMHFFSTVSGDPQYPNNVLPSCWVGDPDQNWPVNLSVFSSTAGFPQMTVGASYGGFARMNFNNYSGSCYNQINKFRYTWYNVCITHPTASSWVVTTDACGAATNYGTGNLQGQGGKNNQTINYGDWRVPFKLTLTK